MGDSFLRIHEAFKAGDLDALLAAVPDRRLIPNGDLGDAFGDVLVYAIYHSPLEFVQQLLELGADPNPTVDDGFPPLLAAISAAQPHPGAMQRVDLPDLLDTLLAAGADPNVRGINDWTALHMAVNYGDAEAVRILLAHRADPRIKTRIDDCETPGEQAEREGKPAIAALLAEAETARKPRGV